MPRHPPRKTPKKNPELMTRAVEEVKRGGKLLVVAKKYGVSRDTLRRRVKNPKSDLNSGNRVSSKDIGECLEVFYSFCRICLSQIFSCEQEIALKKYALRSVAIYFGLTNKALRRLAFDFAVKLKRENAIKKVPPNWREERMASDDWRLGFMSRHPELASRKSQATSIARATSFNRHNVQAFFTNLGDVLHRFNILPENIWNMDESALTTVHKPAAVVAGRGARTVGSMTSAERGVLVTLALCVSAMGVCLPPFYIFPRVKFDKSWLALAGEGANGAANPSGWMKADQFLIFLEHFKRYAHASAERPTLLIMDNHSSHLSIKGLEFCKANGIIVLTLPPHTSHKLQPLDRSVFGPIKKFYNEACRQWMRLPQHAAQPIQMSDIPGLARDAIQSGATSANIQSGFRVAGIHPFNPNIFPEEEFLPADITDRPPVDVNNPADCVEEVEAEMEVDVFANVEIPYTLNDEEPSTSYGRELSDITNIFNDEQLDYSYDSEPRNLMDEELRRSLEELQPLPKAGPRKRSNRGRKTRKTAIATDEVVMESLRVEQQASADKKAKQAAAKVTRAENKVKKAAEKIAKAMEKERKAAEKAAAKESKETASKRVKRGRGRPRKEPVCNNDSDSSESEQDSFCCVCYEVLPRHFTNRKCVKCDGYAHRDCVGKIVIFTCPGCSSEPDDEDSESNDSSSDEQS